MPVALTRTRSGRGVVTASVNEVVENENGSREEEDDSDLTGAFVVGGVVPAGQDSNVSIMGELSVPTLQDDDTNEEDETVLSSVTGGSNDGEIVRPTICLTTPTPATLDDAMTIINKLVADNKTLRKMDKEHRDKVSIFCTEKLSRKRTGRGKNKFKDVMKNLTSEETHYLLKIDELLTELIFPQAHFLLDKWHIWSTEETSFCYLFLKKAGWDAYPATYNSMADYWVHFVAPRINYKYTIRRGNLGTRVKAAFNGLSLCYLMIGTIVLNICLTDPNHLFCILIYNYQARQPWIVR